MVQSDDPVPPLVIMMDPPAHRRMRNLVNKVFTPRAIQRQQQMVTEQIERVLASADPENFDVVQDFSALFPVEVITGMLGVPAELRQQVRLLLDKQLEREYGNIGMLEGGLEAGIETGLMYYNIIGDRRADPQDDMISSLIAVEVEREDGTKTQLDDIEIAGFASMLGGAGAETVTKLVGNAVVTFAEHPDQWQMLLERSQQDSGGGRGAVALGSARAVCGALQHERNRVARQHNSCRKARHAGRGFGEPGRTRLHRSRYFRHRA